MPNEWIERLFQRLAEFYGARFADMWRFVDAEDPAAGIARVKATWAAALADCTAEQVRGALAFCLERHAFAPTLPEFVQLCKVSKRDADARRLVHRVIKTAETEIEHEKCMAMARTLTAVKPRGLDWAEKLRDKHAAGERLLPIQIAMYQEALASRRDSGQTGDATHGPTPSRYE